MDDRVYTVLMSFTISADEPRSIKALEIAARASSWLKCRATDGRKAYGIPSAAEPGRFYLVTQTVCDCEDAKRHPGQPCKHVLAVRLHIELAKAQQPERSKPSRPVLEMVRHDDGELSWERRRTPPASIV